MTNSEFSNQFTVELNNYFNVTAFGDQNPKTEIELDEYEKSLFLTQAQEDIVIELYNGRNVLQESFEESEELRRYLENLIKTEYVQLIEGSKYTYVSDYSYTGALPEDLMFITMEQVIIQNENCDQQDRINVLPVKQDEFNKVIENPFRGPSKFRALRLDIGDNQVEIVTKNEVLAYIVRYLRKPNPIILENLPGDLTINGSNEETSCELNERLHSKILERAVLLAIKSRSISSQK